MIKLKEEIEKGKKAEFHIRDDGMIVKGQRMCVPEYGELKREIMEEAHSSAYAMHPGSTKMYKTLKEHYWWNGKKKEIASFVSRCLTCQQVKTEHQKPAGKIQLLPIQVWKWEKITMDFVTGFPRTKRQHDAIWLIVDLLTKSAHFLLVNVEDSLEKLAQLYVDEIVRLHGVTSRFWPSLQTALGARLHFSTTFHPQTDGQSERTIQTLEDMLRACVMEFKGSWDTHLALMEFAYNNSYQASIDMAPFEALYGKKCRTPMCWDEFGERRLVGPELVQITSEKEKVVRDNLKIARDRKRSYADNRRRDLQFEIGDQVFLKISPWKGVLRFGK